MDKIASTFDQQKQEIELSLARIVLTQLQSEKIPYKTAQEMANAILDGMDESKDQTSMMTFLQTLSEKWEVFDNIRSLYRLKLMDVQDTKKKLEETKGKLSQFIN